MNWAALSCPERELDAVRVGAGRAGVVGREMSLSEMIYAGYWRCGAPCYHVQPKAGGEICGSCMRRMQWEAGIGL